MLAWVERGKKSIVFQSDDHYTQGQLMKAANILYEVVHHGKLAYLAFGLPGTPGFASGVIN